MKQFHAAADSTIPTVAGAKRKSEKAEVKTEPVEEPEQMEEDEVPKKKKKKKSKALDDSAENGENGAPVEEEEPGEKKKKKKKKSEVKEEPMEEAEPPEPQESAKKKKKKKSVSADDWKARRVIGTVLDLILFYFTLDAWVGIKRKRGDWTSWAFWIISNLIRRLFWHVC